MNKNFVQIDCAKVRNQKNIRAENGAFRIYVIWHYFFFIFECFEVRCNWNSVVVCSASVKSLELSAIWDKQNKILLQALIHSNQVWMHTHKHIYNTMRISCHLESSKQSHISQFDENYVMRDFVWAVFSKWKIVQSLFNTHIIVYLYK